MLVWRASLGVWRGATSPSTSCQFIAAAKATTATTTRQDVRSQFFLNVRYAATSSKRKSNNVERAIRLKNQERSRRRLAERVAAANAHMSGHIPAHQSENDDGIKLQGSGRKKGTTAKEFDLSTVLKAPTRSNDDKHGRGRVRPVRSPSSSIRDAHFKVARRLQLLINDAKLPPEQAFQQAKELVEKTPTIMRREPRIYNLYVRHALRAGKKNAAFKIIGDMKKNGCAVTVETYIAVFSNLLLMNINPKVETIVFERVHALYNDMLSMWRAAQDRMGETTDSTGKRGTRAAKEIFGQSTAEEVKGHGYKTFDPRFVTWKAFKESEAEAYDALIQEPEKFVRACDTYLNLLLKHDDLQRAIDVLEESQDLVQLTRRNLLSQLQKTLAVRVLNHYQQQVNTKTTTTTTTTTMTTTKEEDNDEVVELKKELHAMAVTLINRHQASLRSIGNDDVDTFHSDRKDTQERRPVNESRPSFSRRRTTVISDEIVDDGPPGHSSFDR